MRALPLPDATADLCLAYSGLHMVGEPRAPSPSWSAASSPAASCAARRSSPREPAPALLLGHGARTGQNGPLRPPRLRGRLEDAGIADVEISPERGLAMFRGRR